jgi:beta-barrel assembly-enhancing protease
MITATAFSKERTLTGHLEVAGELVRFSAAVETIEMPVSGLKITRGGYNNEHIFLEHPAQPGWSVSTRDAHLLSHPGLVSDPEIAGQLKTLPRENRGRGLVVAAAVLVALLAGLIVTLVACREWLVEKITDRIPVSWEIGLGESLYNQIKSEEQVVSDSAREKQIAAITAPLLEVAGTNIYRFQFHVINDTNINAFAIPGGHIFINTGLLDAADTPEEIAGVLAHEIAHVTERHGFRSIINAAGLYLIVQFFFGDTSGAMALLTDGSRKLLEQSYSRDFERQADDLGWNYLVKANIDPRGMVRFFKRMKEEEAKNPQLKGALQLLSTHPATDERMQRLEEKWTKLARKDGFRSLNSSDRLHVPNDN